MDEIIGIAVYAAVRPVFVISTESPLHLLNVDITYNGVRKLCKERILHSWGLDHIWLEYSALEPFKLKGKSLKVKFTCYSSSLSLKCCGVQLVHKHADNAKDHSDVFYEYDCNLESDYYPPQKRHSTTLDIKNSNFEDTQLGESPTKLIKSHKTLVSLLSFLHSSPKCFLCSRFTFKSHS